MEQYNVTFFEACEFLSRSRKSVSRYIRRGLLHPKYTKSAQGTLEYRFNMDDLETFKSLEGTAADDAFDEPEIGPKKTLEVVENLGKIPEESEKTRPPETTPDNSIVPFLMKQIEVKDELIKIQAGQIDEMIERDRETNILLRNEQEVNLKLSSKKDEKTE